MILLIILVFVALYYFYFKRVIENFDETSYGGVIQELNIKTHSMADAIAAKIDLFAAQMRGEGSDNTTSASDSITSLTEKHFEFLEDCRQNNPSLYCLLLAYATCGQSLQNTLCCDSVDFFQKDVCQGNPLLACTNALLMNSSTPLTPDQNTITYLQSQATLINQ